MSKSSVIKLLFAFLISVGSLTAVAQTEITGKIVDFATFEPVVGANIYIQNSTVGTVSNTDGKYALKIPQRYVNDTLVISSIGYKSFKTAIQDYDFSQDLYLEEDVASLDEILIVADTRPKTGNDIVLRALERLERNAPDSAYIQKAFLRHKEKNKNEYKWLIESAITLYDSSYAYGKSNDVKISVDENRKSYDLRDVDSVFTYYSYLKNKRNLDLKSRQLRRDTIQKSSLVKAIKWNDERTNGLDNLFNGKLNLVRNSNRTSALFGKNMLEKHQFSLDTILVDNDRKLYKIKISKSSDFVGLNTPGIFNEGFEAQGWIYIYWDNFAIKKLEYELVAASEAQKRRSKSLFGTQLNHKLIITYKEFEGKMYPSYIYYETPKLVNIGDRSSDRPKDQTQEEKDEQFYFTIQEIVFTEIIQDPVVISAALNKNWNDNIFEPRPYNKEFWESYNVLLESEEEEQLIRDLSKRASLFQQ
ncbi:carboxypeptidase-like regulatory domain-containing protein [Jejudonia soesokkakensis]|uniref:Carboxypeptidase-like regulatory domain-containing protein n=1 Tax=Jejudonia soesokkakensis TaxID=1323432 RepID=A0ABW2MS55_9FLAO